MMPTIIDFHLGKISFKKCFRFEQKQASIISFLNIPMLILWQPST